MSKFARRRRPSGRPAPAAPARPRPAFRLEQLETRDTPATFVWTGAGADNRWATPENWLGDQAPTGLPGEQADLVFPAGADRPTNQNDIPSGTFNSLTIGGPNYRLIGLALTLGIPGVVGSGTLVVNDGAAGNSLNIDTTLGLAAGSDQTFTVGTGADLTVTSRLSGPLGATLTKDGAGTLTLLNDNSGLTGTVRVDDGGGRLVIGHRFALGNTANGTTVGANATLGVSNVTGPILESLTLNGPGADNAGALNNLAGNNVWAGLITLDSNATIGAVTEIVNGREEPTVLIVTGQIRDSSSGYDLTKEGRGEVRLNTNDPVNDPSNAGNTYRGTTFVNNGILTVGHPRALGTAGSPANGTVVSETLTGAGQLRLSDATAFGFAVVDEYLTLNGEGIVTLPNRGALTSVGANHTWAGPVVLGSPAPDGLDVTVGAEAGRELTITGQVSSPNGPFVLTKRDRGRVILAGANTYTGATQVVEGALQARDSNALGAPLNTGAEVQVVQVLAYPGFPALGYPPVPVPFRLTFRGYTTRTITVTPTFNPLLAADLEGALNGLPSIGGVGGRVMVTAAPVLTRSSFGVTEGGTRFTVTFAGSLIGSDIEPLAIVTDTGPFDFLPPWPIFYPYPHITRPGSVYTVQEGSDTAAEVQSVRVTKPTGNFRLGFNGTPLQSFPVGATAAQLAAALNAAQGVPAGGRVVVERAERANGFEYFITFDRALFGVNVPQVVVQDPDDPNGQLDPPAVAAFTHRQGGVEEVQSVRITSPTQSGSFGLNFYGQSLTFPFGYPEALLERDLNFLPSVARPFGPFNPAGAVKVRRATLPDGDEYFLTFTGAFAGVDVAPIRAIPDGGVKAFVQTRREGGGGGATVLRLENSAGGFRVQFGDFTIPPLPPAPPAPQLPAPLPYNIPAFGGDPTDPTSSLENALNFPGYTFGLTGRFVVRDALAPAPGGREFRITWVGDDGFNAPPPLTATGENGTKAFVVLDRLGNGGELQEVRVTGTAGTFTVTLNAQTTAALPVGASAERVENALNALPGLPGRVSVLAFPAPLGGDTVYRVSFYGGFVGTNPGQMTASGTGGAAATVRTAREGFGAAVSVFDGASVELGVEAADPATPRFDPRGVDLWADSVTADPNKLAVRNPIHAAGRGFGQAGAVRNVSGINDLRGGLLLGTEATFVSTIGSDPDPRPGHPTADASYFTSDYSLTVSGLIEGPDNVRLAKRGGGHLILPRANTFQGAFGIEEGWVTVQNNDALGAPLLSFGEGAQPGTQVFTGAALHLRPLTPGRTLTLDEPLTLGGSGPAHPYAYLNRAGALVNLGGANTWTGDIRIKGPVGIGAEQVAPRTADPLSESDLAVATTIGPAPRSYTFRTFNETATGGDELQAFLFDTGATGGNLTLNYQFFGLGWPNEPPDQVVVNYPPRPAGGVIYTSGPVVSDGPYGPTTVTVPYGPGPSTLVEVVVNPEYTPTADHLNAWQVTVTLPDTGDGAVKTDGLVKTGSKRVRLQGDGAYSGAVDVQAGTLVVQHDAALGRAASGTLTSQQTYSQSTTTVASGAVVEFATGVARLSGGNTSGVQVWDERLVLGSPAQQVAVAGGGGTFTLTYRGQTTASLQIGAAATEVAAALNALTNVQADVGSVFVTRAGNVFTVVFGTAQSTPPAPLTAAAFGGAEVAVSGGSSTLVNLDGDNAWRGPVALTRGNRIDTRANSRLSLFGPVGDADNPAAGGSDLVKRGAGELLLGGDNTYRGLTRIDQGVVTAMSGTAFGSTAGGTEVADEAQLQLQGSLTVAGERLTVRGNGPDAAQSVPARWYNTGPAPTNNGLAPLGLPTTGRITSLVADPTDPSTLYLASAGGGAWKTRDGGRTWLPLFDQTRQPAGVPGGALLYGGSIAVAPSNPRVVYFATGETNGQDTFKNIFDSYAGSGVYKSTDAGETWTLLFGPDDENPLSGQSVSRVVVDDLDPDVVYAASGSRPKVTGLPGGVANLATGRRFRVSFEGRLKELNQPLLAAADTGDVQVFVETAVNGRPPMDDQDPPLPGVDEVQWVTVYGDGGTFTLTFNGVTTGPIPVTIKATGGTSGNPADPDASLDLVLSALSSIKGTDPDPAKQGKVTVVEQVGKPTPGVWRYSGTPGADGRWRNLTGNDTLSLNRRPFNPDDPALSGTPGAAPFDAPPNGIGPPRNAGPDDDYRIAFPQEDAIWSDLFVFDGVLYAALGESTQLGYQDPVLDGEDPPQYAVRNAVYKSANPRDDAPSWYVGPLGGGPDSRPSGQGAFPYGGVDGDFGRNGWIKIAGTGREQWAIVTDPSIPNPDHRLLDLQFSTDGGNTWTQAQNNPPLLFGPTFLTEQGRYDVAIAYDPTVTAASPVGTVYVAGRDRIYFSVDRGQNWASINPDIRGGGPARFFHSLAVDRDRNLLVGTDGGAWRYDFAAGTFVDLAGTLGATQLFSADPHPTDLGQAIGGARNTGTQFFRNGTAWERVDSAAGENTTAVRYDGRNPRTAYAIRNGDLRKTTDGGITWASLATGTLGMYVDPVNPARLLVSGLSIRESVAGGAGLVNLNAPVVKDPVTDAVVPYTSVASATFQGPFAPDPDFPTVTDVLANTYNPSTIYATEGAKLFLTKNRGVSWVNRTPAAALGGTITDIAVDQSNRDTVYLAVSRPTGVAGGRVFRSTDAGRTWVDLSGVADPAPADEDVGPLPKVPVWRLAVDPRPDGTAVYLGNDTGVWRLSDARNAAPNTLAWSRVGAGLPRVAVRDIVLNQTLNTLTAASYGRGMFQYFLPDPEGNSGAVRAVSGSSVWTGEVVLAGPTTLGVAGTQQVSNGIATAGLNILGTVSDGVAGANHPVRKIGGGTLTLSGPNTYGGRTDVLAGALSVNNPKALGAAGPAANTVVSDGAVLELRSDLEAEPVQLTGRGLKFNDRFTGSLRNVSNDNVYTGVLTLASDVTIGADSGTTLTIGRKAGLSGTGTITDGAGSFSITKELPGTLALAAANSHDGLTTVAAGALQVQHPNALGGVAQGTVVLDGAQLQVARNAFGGADTAVAGERLTLSGTGINRTGALLGLAGSNSYGGPIDFAFRPNSFPPTNPGGQIAVGAAGPDDVLTVDAVLGPNAADPGDADDPRETYSLLKVGSGTVVLPRANTYVGGTFVEGGALRLRNSAALGSAAPSPEVQQVTVVGTTGNFTLAVTAKGQTRTTAAIQVGASAATVQTELEAMSNVDPGDVFVRKADITGGAAYTLFFGGSLAAADVPQIVGAPAANPAVSVATVRNFGLGTVVSAGATLELDGLTAAQPVNELLTINGDGVGGQGALRAFAGLTNTYAGKVTLGSNASLGAAANSALTVTGRVTDPSPAPVPPSRLRKAGAGLVELTADNPIAGRIVIDDGVLRVANPLALGSTGPEVQTVLVTGTNGTFALTFNGATTPFLPFDATAGAVQTALNNLSTVGGVGGSAAVGGVPSAGGTLFTIAFGLNLGATDLPPITTQTTGAASAFPTTLRDGPEGTVVNPGGTLQIAGNKAFTQEALTLRGAGFQGQGALNNAAGTNSWDTPITLAENATIGAAAGTTLTLSQPTSDGGNKYDLDVVGAGTVAFTASADNQYTGTTTVRGGVLRLSQPAGVAIQGALVVGGGATAASVRATTNNQVADASTVTVNPNGTFDLNGQTDAVGLVTANGGTDPLVPAGVVRTGANGKLTAPGLALPGGTVDIGTGGRVVLGGNVTATSTAGHAAAILGPGSLDLNGTDRTLNVADGPAAVDVQVGALLATPTTAKLTKDGAGRAAFSAAATTAVVVAVRNGDVQVDTTLGAVELTAAGASLSGTGTAGAVRGATLSAPAVGTVAPGNNWAANPAGILRAGTTRLGAQSTFFVNLAGRLVGDPVAGTHYDQLQVSGAVVLGGAKLEGTFGTGIQNLDRFTIITATGGVTGRFAEPNGAGIVYIQGQKFNVLYSATEVVLEKVKAKAEVGVVTSANPSTLDQPVTFTATVTPESGATLTPSTVTFFVDGSAVASVALTVLANGSGTAALTLPDAGLGLPALTGGSHAVSAVFNGDADTFNPASVNLAADQVVEVPDIGDLTVTAPTATPRFISPNNSPGVQDALTGTATVTGERARATWTVTVKNAGGTAVRTITGTFFGNGQVPPVNTFPINAVWDGKDDAGNFVADGAYAVTVAFTDEYDPTPATPRDQTAAVGVTVDNTSPALSGVTVPTRRFRPGTTARLLDATITEANLTGWTVTLRNAGGAVVRTFTGTGTTAAVDFDGTDGAGNDLADGVYAVELVVTDAAGNTAAAGNLDTVLVLEVEPTADPLTGSPAFISPNNSLGTQDTAAVSSTVRDVSAPTATWTVTVKNAAGTAVRTVTRNAVINTATKTFPIAFTWDGKTDGGSFVPDGVYTISAGFTAFYAAGFDVTGSAGSVTVTVDNLAPTAGPAAAAPRVIAPGTAGSVPTETDLTGTVGDGVNGNLRDWTLTVKNAGGAVVRTFTGTGTAAAATFDGRDAGGAVLPDGTYTVELTARDQAGNTATGTAGTVVVLTQPPTVTLVSNTPTVYGQTITLTATVTTAAAVRDLLNGVSVDFVRGGVPLGSAPLALVGGEYKATITVPTFAAGTYADLSASSAGTDVFLAAASAAATHVVTPAPLTVRATNATKVYGAAVPALAFTAEGLVNGDTAAVVVSGSPATTAAPGSDVGTYPITQGTVAANGNYTLTFAPATLSVTPAPLLVRANDASRVVGTPNPPFTASYQGLVLNDTPAVVNGLILSTPATTSSRVGTYPVVAGGAPTARNYAITVADGTLSVVPAPTDVVLGGGTGAGGGVRVFAPDGSVKSAFNPFPGFTGSIRTASADFNRDGVDDVVVVTGPGVPVQVVVLDGAGGPELFRDSPYGDFAGGAFAAVGDVDGDGQPDLVVTPDEGGGPRVVMYRGGDYEPVLSYLGIDDENFRGGARAAVGDMNGDGFAEIAVSAGFGGGPRLSIWDGAGLARGQFRTLVNDFFTFESRLRNGTYAAIGDVNADGFGDLIVGAGPGGGPRVLVLDGRTILDRGGAAAVAAPVANFFAGNVNNRGGVRVAAKSLDGDLSADVVTGPGEGDRSVATAYRGSALARGAVEALYDLPGFDDLNGVYVG